jgi:hypothetical protein
MLLLTVVNTTSSSQDFDDFDDSPIKLNTQGINFRSSQFRPGEEVNVVQTKTQVIVILPI